MKILHSFAAGAIAPACPTGSAHAQDAKQPTAQQAAELPTKVKEVGMGIVALGRAEQDPLMLIAGAMVLSGIGGVEGAEDASKAYDVSTILSEAKILAGDDQHLLDQIAAIETGGGSIRSSGELNCDWVESCGLDPSKCRWVAHCY